MKTSFPTGLEMDAGLALLVFEAAVALALLVFIVWWTLPKKRRDRQPPPDRD